MDTGWAYNIQMGSLDQFVEDTCELIFLLNAFAAETDIDLNLADILRDLEPDE